MRKRPQRDFLVESAKNHNSDECLNWPFGIAWNGYGVVYLGERVKPKISIVPRAAYRLVVGSIPEGLLVCHTCDNRACYNPRHLFVGTQKENLADMIRKGRNRKGSRPNIHIRGEKNPHCRLNVGQVREIRSLHGTASHRELAARFGVTQNAVKRIFDRTSWAWVS